jgi:hypothetical protein
MSFMLKASWSAFSNYEYIHLPNPDLRKTAQVAACGYIVGSGGKASVT